MHIKKPRPMVMIQFPILIFVVTGNQIYSNMPDRFIRTISEPSIDTLIREMNRKRKRGAPNQVFGIERSSIFDALDAPGPIGEDYCVSVAAINGGAILAHIIHEGSHRVFAMSSRSLPYELDFELPGRLTAMAMRHSASWAIAVQSADGAQILMPGGELIELPDTVGLQVVSMHMVSMGVAAVLAHLPTDPLEIVVKRIIIVNYATRLIDADFAVHYDVEVVEIETTTRRAAVAWSGDVIAIGGTDGSIRVMDLVVPNTVVTRRLPRDSLAARGITAVSFAPVAGDELHCIYVARSNELWRVRIGSWAGEPSVPQYKADTPIRFLHGITNGVVLFTAPTAIGPAVQTTRPLLVSDNGIIRQLNTRSSQSIVMLEVSGSDRTIVVSQLNAGCLVIERIDLGMAEPAPTPIIRPGLVIR
jgi:hypothetical protein